MSKVLVFDTGSSFGYFRKSFTTTNALTHAMIPRSAVEGLVGAIIGLSRIEYPEMLQTSKIAIEILSPVRKVNMKYMHTNPDWWKEISLYLMNKSRPYTKPAQFAVPASVEFLVNPKYRIYLDNPPIHSKLMCSLKKKQAFFTPYLGTSSMICFVKYIDEYNYTQISSDDYVSVSSIVSFSNNMPQIKLEKGLRFAIEEGLPMHIDSKRIPSGVYKVIYTTETGPITLIDDGIVELQKTDGNKYVKFLPAQVAS